MMNFEFVIYETPDIIVDGVQWYLAPFYDYEISMLSESFTEGIDFVRYMEWQDEPYESVSNLVRGYDVLINSKIFTWFSLKYGQASVDIFTDLQKFDKDHYEFDIKGITNAIQTK
jgi:hypothetical protein